VTPRTAEIKEDLISRGIQANGLWNRLPFPKNEHCVKQSKIDTIEPLFQNQGREQDLNPAK
jgi:hypothetical protein